MEKFKHLSEFFKENWKSYLIGVLFLIGIDTAQLFVPRITKAVADDFVANNLDSASLMKYALLTLGTGLILMVGRYIWRIKIFTPARRMEYYLRDKIFKKLLTLSPEFFTENKTGDLMALATNDVNAVRMASGGGMVMLVDSTFMMLLSLIMMIKTAGFKLASYVLIVLPVIVIFVLFFGRIIHRRFLFVQETFGLLMERSREHYAGVRVIKAFSREGIFEDIFLNSSDENYKANVRLMRLQAFFRPFIMFVSGITILLVIRFGGAAVINRTISLGDFIAFQMYLDMLIWPLMAFGMVINFFQRGSASLSRIADLLDEEPKITDPNPDCERMDFDSVEFKNVSYKYPGHAREVLKDINFKLEKGKSLAILGTTGSGKSTIIKLLLRLYDLRENEGEILFDGEDIKKVSLSGMRKAIGTVFQENFLFSDTIENNIAFENTAEEMREEIVKASILSDLHGNIENFPDKYETLLGEMGVTLSGGQKQRTSLARAIYRKPSLLILDDAFSAVDTETEERILNNLKGFKDIALLIISHRVSTVKDADEILILDEGKIIERGSDKSLMDMHGEYYNLAMKQKLEERVRGRDGER